MSQEFHVARPAHFFAGNITRAAKHIFGDRATVIGAHQMPPAEAAQTEQKVLQLLTKHSGHQFAISNDETVWSTQFNYSAWHHVRAFAAYQDYPFRKMGIFGKHTFEKGFNPENHPALTTAVEKRKCSCPNLVISLDNMGFFFPVPLKKLISTQWGYIGSSIGLQEEVKKIADWHTNGDYWHQDIDSFIEIFTTATSASIKSGLPIIIDG